MNKGGLQDLLRLPNFKSMGLDLMLSTTCINLLSLALPLTMMQVFDRIIGNKSTGTLAWLILGCLTAMFFENALKFVRTSISGWLGARFEYKLSNDAAKKVLSSRLDDFEKDPVGKHMERFNAINDLRNFYSGQVFQVLLDLPFASLFLFGIYLLGNSLVLFPIGMAILYFLVFFYLQSKYKQSRNSQQDAVEGRMSFLIESLRRIHMSKTLSMEEQILRKYEHSQKKEASANLTMLFWTMTPSQIGGLFTQCMMFGTIFLGASSIMDGSMTIGSLTACMMMSARFMTPIQSVSGFFLQYTRSKLAKEKLNLIHEMRDDVPEGLPIFPEINKGSIELEDISFRYGTDKPWVVRNLNLKIRDGELTVITSNRGEGATTLLNLVMGTLKPEKGEALIGNHRLSQWDHSDFRGHVEFLSYQPHIFSGTILENITMFHPERESAALEASSIIGLVGGVSQMPLGFATPLTPQSALMLPASILQKIALSRALTVRPKILLLDRTSSMMDTTSEERFFWLLDQLKGQSTILFATDSSRAMEMADRIYELKEGHLSNLFRIRTQIKKRNVK